jgi:hypothetical protein
MGDVRADLDEGAEIEQQLDSLARGQAALGVLFGDTLGAPAGKGFGAAALPLGNTLLSIQVVLPLRVRWAARSVGSASTAVKAEGGAPRRGPWLAPPRKRIRVAGEPCR